MYLYLSIYLYLPLHLPSGTAASCSEVQKCSCSGLARHRSTGSSAYWCCRLFLFQSLDNRITATVGFLLPRCVLTPGVTHSAGDASSGGAVAGPAACGAETQPQGVVLSVNENASKMVFGFAPSAFVGPALGIFHQHVQRMAAQVW